MKYVMNFSFVLILYHLCRLFTLSCVDRYELQVTVCLHSTMDSSAITGMHAFLLSLLK